MFYNLKHFKSYLLKYGYENSCFKAYYDKTWYYSTIEVRLGDNDEIMLIVSFNQQTLTEVNFLNFF
jgi:hypothetical protein